MDFYVSPQTIPWVMVKFDFEYYYAIEILLSLIYQYSLCFTEISFINWLQINFINY
jgi:hypothetical protein